MSSYQIVCVVTKYPHRHIEAVGTGVGDRADKSWSVEEVRHAIASGDTFHTTSRSTGRHASVLIDNCNIDRCTVKTIRSTPDAIADNNLDHLRTCNFQ